VIELINGKGQLGEQLSKIINSKSMFTVIIHHTWNFIDKSEETQKKCFNDFQEFINKNSTKRVAFISTYTTNWTPYLKYKLKAELYLLKNVMFSKVYRLPNLIGKGVCEGFKNKELNPDFNGEIEIMSPYQAAIEIIKDLGKLDWSKKIIRIRGTVTTPQTVYDLIRFGND